MNVGSLFTGIGGFDLGLERAGMRVVWQCEQDEYCRRVLARHWPDVPCYPDVRALVADTGRERGAGRGATGYVARPHGGAESEARQRQRPRDAAGDGRAVGPDVADGAGALVPVPVPPVDVLCGGFPCQDISLAGKGAGIDGARSGLWGEYARLVGELRPRYVIVENVAALLARGLDRVLCDLAALGYDAEWDCLPASAFGAPHRRDRLWLVAYPNGEGEPGRPVDAEPGRGLVVSGGAVADTERSGRSGRPQDTGRGSSDGQTVERREGAGQPARRGAEAGVVPDADGERLQAVPRQRCDEDGFAPGGDESSRLQDADERALQPWRVGGRAAQTGGAEWWAVEPPVGRVAYGVPDRLDQLGALGNALVPQIAEWLGRRILEAEAMNEQRAA